MKYISAMLLLFFISMATRSQSLPDYFLDGKAVVMISAAPQARPSMDWKAIAEEIHPALVAAGGDPVAYYELEDVALSEEIQATYAQSFIKRQVKCIIILTRKTNAEIALTITPFTNNKAIISNSSDFSLQVAEIPSMSQRLEEVGKIIRSKNMLVVDVPEYLTPEGSSSSSQSRFLARNPLNLDVFKLGVPLSGSVGESGFLTMYRYDLLGKTAETIASEQMAEKRGMESILNANYPFQVAYLTEARTEAELIRDRIQFILMRVEGREADLMESMGLEVTDPAASTRIVVKYYIKFLVRNELYIGPVWDADPNWQKSLSQFLENLKIQ
ncbi:NTPase [Belliella kenyensis]|uniref:NTPase n=1 Tax=Belliella kenyensis TaxID=1472724 RepID=A0ABV8ELD8_9BACT|nr:NTPase [Belliella kenyensis]MCH7401368.1 NTPase [Belliella kenyensis]MDN3602811.1 NTPase [Belliella kenyensis]